MSNSKHTPGPLTVIPPLNDSQTWYIETADGMPIGRTSDENMAHLFARAPELLVENERLRDALENIRSLAESEVKYPVIAARAEIALAAGKGKE